MRKKTIEEELKEIAAEKEAHIQKVESRTGHSDDHRYDFSPYQKNDKKDAERKYTVRGVKVTKAQYDELQNDFKVLAKTETEMNNAKNELAKMKSERNSVKKGEPSNDDFTIADYKKMVELEERELSDEEFDEYYNLCDRFGDLSEEKRDNIEKLYDVVYSQKSTARVDTTNTSTQSTNTYSHPQNTNSTPRKRDITLGSALFPIIFLCFFVAAGLGVMFGVGVVPWVKYSSYIDTTATVEEIRDSWRNDGYLYAELYISYDFDGETHYATIDKKVESRIEAGVTQIQILVNPKNPEEIKINDGSSSYIFPTIFGLVFAGFAIIMQAALITQVVKAKKRNRKI